MKKLFDPNKNLHIDRDCCFWRVYKKLGRFDWKTNLIKNWFVTHFYFNCKFSFFQLLIWNVYLPKKKNRSQQVFLVEQKHRQFLNRWSIIINIMQPDFQFFIPFQLCFAKNMKKFSYQGNFEVWQKQTNHYKPKPILNIWSLLVY